MKDDFCEIENHKLSVKLAKANMPDGDEVQTIATRFKVLSQPSRLNILFALIEGELCVEHITEAVNGNQSAVSHQLRILRDNKIIKCKRKGKQMIYCLADEHIIQIVKMAKEHLHCD